MVTERNGTSRDPGRSFSKPPRPRSSLGPNLILFGVVFVLVGSFGFIFGVCDAAEIAHLQEHGYEVDARVVGVGRSEDRRWSESDQRYETVVSYHMSVVFDHPKRGPTADFSRTTSHDYHRFKGASPARPIGLMIVVDPEDTSRWRKSSEVFGGPNYMLHAMAGFGAFGLLLGGAGYLVVRRARRLRAEALDEDDALLAEHS